MKMRARLPVLFLSTAAFACVAAHAGPLLALFPTGSAVSGGDLSGAPGTITGWGFTFVEPDNVFDVVTGSSFCLGSSDGVTDTCILPVLGTYTDFIGPQFIVAGPSPDESPSVHQDFDAIAAMGVGSFAIDPNAAPGVDLGQIVVTYDVYAEDPNLVFSDPIATGQFVTALASVTVTAASASVPEPSTAAMVIVVLIALAAHLRGTGNLVCRAWHSRRSWTR